MIQSILFLINRGEGGLKERRGEGEGGGWGGGGGRV